MTELALEVKGEPAPWTTWPKRGKPPLGFQKMVAWQLQIQAAAKVAWGGKPLLTGPVHLSFVFYTQRGCGDLSNYVKAAEDALQGIVLKNDRQTVHIEAVKRPMAVGTTEGLTVVWLHEEKS